MNLKEYFIKATEEYNTFENHIAAPYMRKTVFSNTKTIANIEIAVCGFYELYINGNKITKGYLAPYISNTDHYIYSDKYEVELDEGENVIGILLGNGFQNNPGGYVWKFDEATYRSSPMVSLLLKFTDKDGKTVEITTDKSFKTHPSPIIFDDYRFGEIYDANQELNGWNLKGFDDSKWSNAIETIPPKGEIKLCEAEPIIKDFEIKPVNIIKDEDGYIYDFGISHSGVCRLSVNGKKGQRIEFQHTDLLKDGIFYIDNLWFKNDNWERDKQIVHKDVYICKGEKLETYTPTFTYHGFRYVKVTGITEEQATKDLLTFIVFHSDLKTVGDFSCSDEIINKLQEITRRSDISNFHYFPTDCPQREKNGWTADMALSCEQTLLNYTPEKSYREWMNNLRKAQTENGEIPAIIPTAGWGFNHGPAWDSAMFYLPYYTYLYRGEKQMILESSDAFIKYLKFLESKKDENGLFNLRLGDWCHVDLPVGIFKAPQIVTSSIISIDIAKKAAFMFDLIGLNDYKEYANNFADEIRKNVRDNLIDFNTMTVNGRCQTSQAMALYYKVFDKTEEQAAFEVLLDLIHEADDHMDVGVLGGKVLFHVLTEFGHSDLAYKMITRTDFPSYGNWIKRGATTLWEIFDKDFVSSPNHHFWGDISAWFIKRIAGIKLNPNKSNVNEVKIKPSFIKNLTDVSAYHIAPKGKITVSWKREEDYIVLNIKIPQGIKAIAELETGYYFENGKNSMQITSGDFSQKIYLQQR